jgi:hypothetical protein
MLLLAKRIRIFTDFPNRLVEVLNFFFKAAWELLTLFLCLMGATTFLLYILLSVYAELQVVLEKPFVAITWLYVEQLTSTTGGGIRKSIQF